MLSKAALGKFAHWAGCYVAVTLFVGFVILAFPQFSDPSDTWGLMQFGILISCVPWVLGGVARLILQSV